MADGEIFTDGTGQGAGLVVSTGILGDLVLPAGAFDPERADEIREFAARAGVLHGYTRLSQTKPSQNNVLVCK